MACSSSAGVSPSTISTPSISPALDAKTRAALKAHLAERGLEVTDFGPLSDEACEYPDFARGVARAVATGECGFGVLV